MEIMAVATRPDVPAGQIGEDGPLLLRRMLALGLDVSACARFAPTALANLQAVCRSCRSTSRCAIDLATRSDGAAGPEWKSYCPNALRLTKLVLNKPTDWVAALRESSG